MKHVQTPLAELVERSAHNERFPDRTLTGTKGFCQRFFSFSLSYIWLYSMLYNIQYCQLYIMLYSVLHINVYSQTLYHAA